MEQAFENKKWIEKNSKRQQRIDDLHAFAQLNEKAYSFVLKPDYKFDDRLLTDVEVNKPPESLFM